MKTLNITQMAEYLGIEKTKVYRMLESGELNIKPIKHFHPRRWNIEDIEAWRKNHAP